MFKLILLSGALLACTGCISQPSTIADSQFASLAGEDHIPLNTWHPSPDATGIWSLVTEEEVVSLIARPEQTELTFIRRCPDTGYEFFSIELGDGLSRFDCNDKHNRSIPDWIETAIGNLPEKHPVGVQPVLNQMLDLLAKSTT